MAAYRVYCMDGVNKVVRAEWVEAESDEEALSAARELMGECVKCEIWQGQRLVAKLSADDWPG